MASNFSLRRSCVGFISIFVEVFWSWSFFVFVQKELFYGCIIFYKNCPLEGKISNPPSFYINKYLTPLLMSPHPRNYFFRYVIGEVICLWYVLDWYCWLDIFQRFVDVDLVNSGDETYCQNFIWLWIQSWNGMLTCIHVSKNSSIVDWNILDSFCLCGSRSNFLYLS